MRGVGIEILFMTLTLPPAVLVREGKATPSGGVQVAAPRRGSNPSEEDA